MLSTAVKYKDYNQPQQISIEAYKAGSIQIETGSFFESWITAKNEISLWDKALEKSTAGIRNPQAHFPTKLPTTRNWESVADDVVRKYPNLWKRLADG